MTQTVQCEHCSKSAVVEVGTRGPDLPWGWGGVIDNTGGDLRMYRLCDKCYPVAKAEEDARRNTPVGSSSTRSTEEETGSVDAKRRS
jgi:hypothetical protein